jgi:hypothetical protein
MRQRCWTFERHESGRVILLNKSRTLHSFPEIDIFLGRMADVRQNESTEESLHVHTQD